MQKFYLLCCLLFFSMKVFSQNTVTGKVTDAETNSPLPGASVVIKGHNSGVVTDNEGRFSLSLPSASVTLVVSSVGYADKEVTASSGTLDISLTQTAKSLNEVVVVGYGTNTKRNLTGNIASVKGADVANMPVANLNQAIQGRAAGVYVQANNGKVGEGVQIRVRGTGSISSGNEPLYVIDGIPVNSNSANLYSGNPLADINFNDIASFDILKDAAAKAIYGARGANGVVLITTKKGRSGKTNFEVNAQYGMNNPTHLRPFLNAKQYVELILEAAKNSDDIEGYTYDDPDSYSVWVEETMDDLSGYADWRTGEINTDWQKYAFNKNAPTYSFNVSASGGNDKTRYYMAANYDNQEGIIIGNTFRRISGRVNLDQNVSDKFKLGFNLSLSQTVAGRTPADNEFTNPVQIVALSPITPLRDLDGNYYNEPVTTYSNPLVDNEFGHYTSTTYRNIGSAYGEYHFTPFLSFRSEFGVDVLNQNDDEFYGPQTVNGNGINGYGASKWVRELTYSTNNYFTFEKEMGNHEFDANLGMTYQAYTLDYASVTGQDFPTQDLQKLASAGTITGGTSVADKKTLLGYFARVNYQFNNRYLLSGSLRTDASSVFGEDNRYGFFPAVSAGWIISDESFLKNSNVLNFLKLRASYGISGNDNIDYYSSLTLWGGSPYNGTSGLVPTQLGNSDLRWEKDQEFDVGFEFGFLKSRLTGEIDYYNRKTTDLLYNVPVPGNSGFATYLKNIGAMRNSGVELVLNSTNIQSKSFRWTSSLNISYNKNEVLALDGSQTIIPGNDGRYMNSLLVGQSIGVFYGPKYAGADPENGDALYYLEDGKTTTNEYNDAGNFVVGNPNPDYIAGLNNTLSFKGIDLSFLFQGVFGNQVMNGAGGFMTSSFDYFDNQTSDQLKRWQKPGDITDVPQLRFYYGNGIGASSRYVYDASYVRLKNVTLSYHLPQSVLTKLKLNSLKVYISGVNLLTFTDYPGWDPEVNTDYRAGNRNQGADFYAAPQIKNFSFGLNAGF